MLKNPITMISVGRHTRLGDVLEQALESLPFQSMETEELSGLNAAGARLLFAASADATGENEQLNRLTQRFRSGEQEGSNGSWSAPFKSSCTSVDDVSVDCYP